jgi:hypothetical protein
MSSNDLINKITLDYLLNTEQYGKYKHTQEKEKNVNKKDKRFYRKRIFNLFKELLTMSKIHENLSPDVIYTFDSFLNASINYFQTLDKSDILQEDYKFMDDTNDDINNIVVENGQSIESANKLVMRSIPLTQGSLSQFVTKKVSKPKLLILPKQREIDLLNPELKTKGIPKKNITNKYDETKDTKTENGQEKGEKGEKANNKDEKQTTD